MEKVFIYGLCDPREPNKIRYVGHTRNKLRRHMEHITERGRYSKCEWVKSLRENGIFPQMIVFEETQAKNALEREKHWITTHYGNLTNRNSIAAPEGMFDSMKDVERNLIVTTLESENFHMTNTAKVLGIGRQTLYNKVARYKIVIPK